MAKLKLICIIGNLTNFDTFIQSWTISYFEDISSSYSSFDSTNFNIKATDIIAPAFTNGLYGLAIKDYVKIH